MTLGYRRSLQIPMQNFQVTFQEVRNPGGGKILLEKVILINGARNTGSEGSRRRGRRRKRSVILYSLKHFCKLNKQGQFLTPLPVILSIA